MKNRRDFLQLMAAGGGAVFLSGGAQRGEAAPLDGHDDFYFVQLSDMHWGYEGQANPLARDTLPAAIAAVNALAPAPDFIVFTGDLTQASNDPLERRLRLAQVRELVSGLTVKNQWFLPGEHDASQDGGAAYREAFGLSYYSFDHKGVHFIALDNVSGVGAGLGEAQLQWLTTDLARYPKNARIVVFCHRPLFDLAPEWDWATTDGAQAIDRLKPYSDVTVFYGHIHQLHHHITGHINHYAATSLVFALPRPHSQAKRVPMLWDPKAPWHGLGWRSVSDDMLGLEVKEHAVRGD